MVQNILCFVCMFFYTQHLSVFLKLIKIAFPYNIHILLNSSTFTKKLRYIPLAVYII